MANTQGSGGTQKNRTLAPAGAGFNLEQFKNEVASEIGVGLGQQGFGQGYANQNAFANQSNFGAGAAQQSAYGSNAGAAQQSAYAPNAGAAGTSGSSMSTAATGSLSSLAAGAQGTSAQSDFETSATLGQKKSSPAENFARQRGQKPSGSSK